MRRIRDFRTITLLVSVMALLPAHLLALSGAGEAPEQPAEVAVGYWTNEQVQDILDATLTIRLAPDLSRLSEAEQSVVADLLAAGQVLHRVYLEQRHPQALEALESLEHMQQESTGDEEVRRLLDLYRIFKGPIATTLDNKREAFVPVVPELPGKNVYPAGVERDEIRAFTAAHPAHEAELLHVRSVARRATEDNLTRDRETLTAHPALSVLHPGLAESLDKRSQSPNPDILYAVPYSVAYSEQLMEVYGLLRHAAETIRPSDSDFAAYLANRARDLLADDYEAGDASWVRGRFGALNAQVGSYETYDDELLGVKSFFSTSVLLRDEERSRDLAAAIRDLQSLENSLPYDGHKKVDSDIPVGVYNVIADFGQARGTNTASILPNEPDHARKYGRTILLRRNIMTHPDLFANTRAAWTAAVAPGHADDLSLDGGFNRTLWHEVGHYLGPATTSDGVDFGVALAEYSDLIEELKSDLVSLHVAPTLLESRYYDEAGLGAVYADGIRRTLQRVKPRRSQPYQTMQLMQMNFFFEKGLLVWDAEAGKLEINYELYPETVQAMLEQVLEIQVSGSSAAAAELIERYGGWDEDLHGVLAANIAEASKYRYRLVRYAALGE
jgi:hypothetical protein